MLRVAGPTFELGMTILHCFATAFGVGSAVLRSNDITPFSVVEMRTPFCDGQ